MNDPSPLDRTLAAGKPDSALSPTVDVAPSVPDPMYTLEAAPPMTAAPVILPAEAYGVGEEIAHGGMGTVLQAEDRRLGRVVAMKVMKLETSASEAHRTRFVREATVLARLEHPNIVPIHELGFDAENRLYYTMKLVQGRTLQGIINGLRRRKDEFVDFYTLDRLLTIFRKICDAMSLAHAKGVIHRDLKPDNIMVGEFGEVLVMDWGLAKILGDSQQAADEEAIRSRALSADAAQRFGQLTNSAMMRSAAALTLDGDVMGTPLYMSPEQAEGRATSIDQQSDVFSLGGILYALLTLHPPVSGETADEILGRIKRGEILPPTVFNAPSKSRGQGKSAVLDAATEPADPKKFQPLPHCPGHKVPSALSAVTMRALAVDKSKRYLTVAELAADIEAYQLGFATHAEHAGLITQLRLLVQRHKREFAVAFAAWFVITALAVWFVINLRAKEQRALAGEHKATASEAVAKSEAARATTAETVAVRERETARQALAKSQLDLAEKEFERGKFVEAQKIIAETPENFRDANWGFLQAHSRDYTAQFAIPGKAGALRLQFLPDGDRFAVRCHAGVIGVFTLSGRQIGNWFNVSGNFWGTFGIDGAQGWLALAASANEVAVQEAATGKLIGRWTCDISPIKDVLLSPDGQTVLVTGSNQLVACATRTGAVLWKQAYNGILPTFSADSRAVAIVSAKVGLTFKIQLLDTVTGAVRSTLEATADNPDKTTLQFNQAGDRLACFGGGEVILWDPRTAAKIRALHFPGENVTQLSPGGDVVATISDSRIRLWDTSTGRLLRSLNGASTQTVALAFSPDAKVLLSSHASGSGGIVNVWPTRLGEEIASVNKGGYQASRIAFNRDGSRFYTAARIVTVGDTRIGLEKWKFATQPTGIIDLAVHPIDGSIVLSEFGKKTLAHVSSDGEDRKAFGTSVSSSVKFNRDGRYLLAVESAYAAANAGGALAVLAYPSGDNVWKHSPNPRQPFAAFCLNEAAIATAARTGGITFWDWKADKQLRQIPATQTGSIGCLAASPDGLHLATGGPDRWIRVWEATTGRLEASFRAHWEGVRSVKFSPDGREILSGSEDGAVRIHDAATGEERLAFHGHTLPVTDVEFSPDGALVAAINVDGFAKVWHRKGSAEAALLPKRPSTTRPTIEKNADGWEDRLGLLTPAVVEKTGGGWSLKNGELFSPTTKFAMLPLPGDLSGVSYVVRVKLRQLAPKDVFHLVLPVGDRMTGFELDGFGGKYTGLNSVNGKQGKDLPGTVAGRQVGDTEPHDLEVTVRLAGLNATISATLDDKPLYEWTGPIAALARVRWWNATEAGVLAFGTVTADWVVSEAKVKPLDSKP